MIWNFAIFFTLFGSKFVNGGKITTIDGNAHVIHGGEYNVVGDGVERKIFVFKVQACKGAIVSFRTTEDEPVYEVVIGDSDNTKSVIKKMSEAGSEVVAEAVHMPLDCDMANPFWVTWHQDTGTLRTGTGIDKGAGQFLRFVDTTAVTVKDISISSGQDVTAIWELGAGDKCNSQPCQQGGTCVNTFEGYQCKCSIGLGGKTCERNEDRITFSHCEEGDASCIGVLKGYKCIPVYAIEESATGDHQRRKRYIYHEQRPLYFGEWFGLK